MCLEVLCINGHASHETGCPNRKPTGFMKNRKEELTINTPAGQVVLTWDPVGSPALIVDVIPDGLRFPSEHTTKTRCFNTKAQGYPNGGPRIVVVYQKTHKEANRG